MTGLCSYLNFANQKNNYVNKGNAESTKFLSTFALKHSKPNSSFIHLLDWITRLFVKIG